MVGCSRCEVGHVSRKRGSGGEEGDSTEGKVCSRDTIQIVMSKGQSGQGEQTGRQRDPRSHTLLQLGDWGFLVANCVGGWKSWYSLGFLASPVCLVCLFAYFGHRNPSCNQMAHQMPLSTAGLAPSSLLPRSFRHGHGSRANFSGVRSCKVDRSRCRWG